MSISHVRAIVEFDPFLQTNLSQFDRRQIYRNFSFRFLRKKPIYGWYQ